MRDNERICKKWSEPDLYDSNKNSQNQNVQRYNEGKWKIWSSDYVYSNAFKYMEFIRTFTKKYPQ